MGRRDVGSAVRDTVWLQYLCSALQKKFHLYCLIQKPKAYGAESLMRS